MNTVAFEIIEQCNLHCDFCVRNASSGLRGQVEVERFRTRARTVAETFGELELIALTGGEPFLHPDLTALLREAGRVARQVSITTNGTRWSPETLDEIARTENIHLIVSIDGPHATSHDAIRGRAGAFKKTVSFIDECRQRDIAVLVNMTVSRANAMHVYDTIGLAARIGARDISVALVKPEGRGAIADTDALTLIDVGRQYMAARKDFESASFVVRFSDPLVHLFDPRRVREGIAGGCGASGNSLHIQCNGTILLCTSCKESLGNIDAVPAFDASVHQRLAALADRDRLGGACGTCELRAVCGGCRCRAAASPQGFLGGDPLCPRNHHAGATTAPTPPDWTARSLLDRWRASGHVTADSARWLILDLPDLAAELAPTGATIDSTLDGAPAAAYDYAVVTEELWRTSALGERLSLVSRTLKDHGQLLVALKTSDDSHGIASVRAPGSLPGRSTVLQSLALAGFHAVQIIEFDASLRLQIAAARQPPRRGDLRKLEIAS